MNKALKSAVALLLVFVLNIGIFAMPAAAATAAYENDLPIVYMRGATRKVYDKNGNQVWPVKKSITDILMENSGDLLSALSQSMLTSDWSIYGDALAKALKKEFSPGTLDKNGNPKKGTAIKKSAAPKKKTSDFKLGDYIFNYDPRLDPWEIADDLSDYINAVLKATGKKKIQLVARCMGSCMASAYLCKYGSSKVDTCIYYASAARGSMVCGELFAGKISFDSENLNDYANEYMGDDEISELLAAVVNVTYTLNLLGEGTAIIDEIYQQLAVEVFPKLLRTTYANMPAYWAMVNEDYFEEAKSFVFGGGYEEVYKGLIEKIDSYHENVMLRLEKDLKTFNKNGMKIIVLAKYGTPFPPYLECQRIQGDAKISIEDISFGAVGADIGTVFSLDYLESAKKSGTIDFISDDLVVDASTCLFPQYTWFVRDIEHGTFPPSINTMFMEFLHRKKQVTVNTFEEYPRYMTYSYEEDSLSPVTYAPPTGDTGTTNPLLNLVNMLKNFLSFILNFFSLLM